MLHDIEVANDYGVNGNSELVQGLDCNLADRGAVIDLLAALVVLISSAGGVGSYSGAAMIRSVK